MKKIIVLLFICLFIPTLTFAEYSNDWERYDSERIGDGYIHFYYKFTKYSLRYKIENATTNVKITEFWIEPKMTWATSTQSKTYTERKKIYSSVYPGKSDTITFDRADYSKLKSFTTVDNKYRYKLGDF